MQAAMNASSLATSNQARLLQRVQAEVGSAPDDCSITQIVLAVLEDEGIDLRNAPTLDEVKELLAAAHESRQRCEA